MWQWNWTGKRAPFAGYARTGRKETCYRKQPGKRTSVASPKRTSSGLASQREPAGNSRDWPKKWNTKGGRQSPGGSLWSTPRRIFEQPRMGKSWKIAVCITKSGPRRRWQPSIASRKTCATIIVSFAKKQWPLSASRQQIFTCSRCKRDREPCRLYSAENDMDPGSVPAELQGLSEVEELLISRAFPIMSIYRKHGGQHGYKGHVLNLPQDIQGFLNSLPANVSDLPILVIRKQGAGEPLK